MHCEYEHQQTGTLFRFGLGVMFLVFAALAFATWVSGNQEAVMGFCVPACILGLVLAMFHALTVRVGPNDIQLRFGVGLIQKSFLVGEIERAFATKSHWYNGWGIRMIRGGWLFNVSGFDVVEIVLRNGRRYQIGTDEPDELLSAVLAALESHP